MNPKDYDKILVIRINHANAGFFAYVTFVINQLRVCELNYFYPVVFLGAKAGKGKNSNNEESYGNKKWDYYFEPVAGMTFNEIMADINNVQSSLNREKLVALITDQLWHIHLRDPDSVYNYPYGHYRDLADKDFAQWYERQRDKANHYINKYIKIKAHITEKVDHFYHQQFDGHRVLGIHMRGSDKGTAESSAELMRIITPEQYYPYIDNYLSEYPDSKIFLATEQTQFVTQIQDRYGDRVIVREAIRTEGFGQGENPFQKRSEGMGYTKGEEVLIDCLLLARCNFLLRCTSAVGEYAMYFNRKLKCIDLNHELAGA
jgi:hypothetical protein